jgi:hypothetical protein
LLLRGSGGKAKAERARWIWNENDIARRARGTRERIETERKTVEVPW